MSVARKEKDSHSVMIVSERTNEDQFVSVRTVVIMGCAVVIMGCAVVIGVTAGTAAGLMAAIRAAPFGGPLAVVVGAFAFISTGSLTVLAVAKGLHRLVGR
jgi:hypothetical protein